MCGFALSIQACLRCVSWFVFCRFPVFASGLLVCFWVCHCLCSVFLCHSSSSVWSVHSVSVLIRLFMSSFVSRGLSRMLCSQIVCVFRSRLPCCHDVLIMLCWHDWLVQESTVWVGPDTVCMFKSSVFSSSLTFCVLSAMFMPVSLSYLFFCHLVIRVLLPQFVSVLTTLRADLFVFSRLPPPSSGGQEHVESRCSVCCAMIFALVWRLLTHGWKT